MLYRLYTENIPNTDKIVSRYYEGYTLITAEGYWQGIAESSLIVEIISSEDESAKIATLANEIKQVNNQVTILVEVLQNKEYFI